MGLVHERIADILTHHPAGEVLRVIKLFDLCIHQFANIIHMA